MQACPALSLTERYKGLARRHTTTFIGLQSTDRTQHSMASSTDPRRMELSSLDDDPGSGLVDETTPKGESVCLEFF